ncbi:hypothetical protein CUN59_15385 [Cuspidothrix issatschenkoi CHARLIE-1]|uniref:Uncharacterized protein n=1 Tax=Cuspidothrix issatschenkoi CHARLIE-1 TaxID=2052836 RepID=A0A2S6CRU6_9CYAN|nr:hypothetical protein CUN59_15385 [Cuspidothrix issatschenkoi CHARLIE-1]
MLLKNQSKHRFNISSKYHFHIEIALSFVVSPKYIGWYEWLEERIDLNEPDIENNQEIESEKTQALL